MKICRAFALLMYLVASSAHARGGAPASGAHAHPKADARGYIDVWRLRDDVAAMEALEVSDDTHDCSGDEGDGTESRASLKRDLQRQKRCEDAVHKAYAPYAAAKRAFNLAWGPVIRAAIRRGDQVAEVILLVCDTTPVLDRSDIQSTCAEDARRRAGAIRRLAEIGFIPATVDASIEFFNLQGLDGEKLLQQLASNQATIMKRMRGASLAVDPGMVQHAGNAPRNAIELAAIERWAVIEAVLQDAPRAFTLSAFDYPRSGVSPGLRLNRQAKASPAGIPTWGRALYYENRDANYHRALYWRSEPRKVHLQGKPDTEPPLLVAGKGAPKFEHARAKLLADMAANIDRYLAQEPRWGVFLLERIGHHEWLPKGGKSDTGMLAAAWEGTWLLDKEARDWTASPVPARAGRAVITRDGGDTRISTTIAGAGEPLANVADCLLRYSGGAIAGPSLLANGHIASAAASAPLLAGTSYKQVLMQCANAEAADVDRVRFLLLAGDVLVEIGAADVFGQVAVRHYHRLH